VSDPESEPDSSSLNMAFAAAAGGDIANPDEGETRHRPNTRARISPPRAELSRGPTANERARSARERVRRTPGRRRLEGASWFSSSFGKVSAAAARFRDGD
jgi:hypothetical protein